MKRSAAACLTALAISDAALAQDRLEGFQPLGVRIGSFTASPYLKVSEEYNSNVLSEERNVDESFITRINPGFLVRSDFSRHALAFEGAAEKAFFHQSSDDDYLDYVGRVRGQLDVTRAARIDAGLGYERGSEGRDSDDSVFGAAEPTKFDLFSTTLSAEYKRGLIRLKPFGSIRRIAFQDTELLGGGVADESGRDRTRYEGGFEAGYEFLRGYEAFVRGSINDTDYDEQLSNGLSNRDGTGYRMIGGFNVDLTRLVTASFGLGYEQRDFDADRFEDYGDITGEAQLSWSVTRLTTIRGGFERVVAETSIEGASHRVISSAYGAVAHELRRNVVLEGAIGLSNDEFQGLRREDDQFTVGAGVEWLVNRNVAVESQYRFTTEDSTAPDNSYDLHQVLVSLKYTF